MYRTGPVGGASVGPAVQVTWLEAVGELLEPFRIGTLDERVICLTERDAFALELARQVFVLVNTHRALNGKYGKYGQMRRNMRPQS